MSIDSHQRLYFLDWLRVGAFALLIPYHTGLIFVDWGFHIRNPETSEALKLPLLFVNQWRLPLLFFIAGAGSFLAIGKKDALAFSRERINRLFVPLVAGILIVIPPQVYFERLSQGNQYRSFFDFYPTFFNGLYPTGNFTWNHLWFVSYLFTYSILCIPVFFLVMKKSSLFNSRFSFFISIGTGLLLCFMCEIFLRPYWPDTRNLISDWYNFIFYLIIFLAGFVLAVSRQWYQIEKLLVPSIVAGVCSFVIIYTGWHSPGTGFLETTSTGLYAFKLLKVMNIFSWISVFIGLAMKFLKTGSKTLQYANRAVYPFYILHQTWIIVSAYFIVQTDWSIASKYLLIVTLTFIMTWIAYHFVILKFRPVHVIFGLKTNTKESSKNSASTSAS